MIDFIVVFAILNLNLIYSLTTKPRTQTHRRPRWGRGVEGWILLSLLTSSEKGCGSIKTAGATALSETWELTIMRRGRAGRGG